MKKARRPALSLFCLFVVSSVSMVSADSNAVPGPPEKSALASRGAPAQGDTVAGNKSHGCDEGEKVGWLEYEPALSAARETGRPLAILFYGENCRKCEMLEEKGFNRPDIACYVNQNLSPVRVNGENSPDIAAKHRVANFPTVWFLTPEAGEIDYFVGYVKPDRLSLILGYIGSGAYRDRSFADYEKEREK